MTKKVLLLAAVAALVFYCDRQPAPVPAASRDSIAEAGEQWQSRTQVSGEGTVSRILDNDDRGDRHQRFILTLDTGRTLLIAHNIDIAPRIDALRVGDSVSFRGEYEWNDRGGVVHWTHHDPDGRHDAGWLRHRGRTYQ